MPRADEDEIGAQLKHSNNSCFDTYKTSLAVWSFSHACDSQNIGVLAEAFQIS